MTDELTDKEKEFGTMMMNVALHQTDNVVDAVIATAIAMILRDDIIDGSDTT